MTPVPMLIGLALMSIVPAPPTRPLPPIWNSSAQQVPNWTVAPALAM